MKRRWISLSRVAAVVFVTVSVVVGGLVLPTDRASAQSPGPGTLRIGLIQDMPDFNIWNLASNSAWKSYIINWGFESLVGYDYDGLPMPMLAQGWTYNSVSLTWTFDIRPGVTFHDGSSLTADDVVFIYTAARQGTIYSSNIINAFDADHDGVVSYTEITTAVVKVDSDTVTMKMAWPYAQFLSTTASVPILPKAIWQNHLNGGGLIDVLWNDPLAAIGTGPYKYAGGVDNEYRIMEKYTGYWGVGRYTPLGYPLFPPHVDELRFDIFPNLDAAVNALQAGAIDHVPMSIPSTRVPDLQADPSVRLNYLSDNGYFYLAFNQKFDPMGDLSFRRAISHVIDKDQIVNVYMGGFGTKGDAVEPPFWGQDAWYNASVAKYPFDADFSTSNALLTAAGFDDANGDGWRDLPDGSPMQKITILTPPADYDPIRIRAGQMIAKNMRDGLNINAEAKALSFDTLVARLQSMDYQMLIIGWSLGGDPVGNVFDVMGPRAYSNTFGFWSEANPNPYYSDLFGVVTRADAETQALADEVLRLDDLARTSLDVSDQMMYTRWAEGVIASAVPVNVLYYRVNVLASSNEWSGWLAYGGILFNIYSLSNLVYQGDWTGYREVTQGLNAGLSVPNELPIWDTAPACVMAIDNLGRPVNGASVAISILGYGGGSATVSATPSSGTTNAKGLFSFSLMGIAQGFSTVIATVSFGPLVSSESDLVETVLPAPSTLALSISSDKMVVRPGETANAVIEVVDGSGLGVAGANVYVDLNLVGYGSVNWSAGTAVTDASGKAYMLYTAPSSIAQYKNSHLTLTLSFTATKTGYEWPAAGAANLLIYIDAAPDWTMAQVDAASTGTVSLTRAANSTSIVVTVTDDDGNALGNHRLSVSYGDRSLVLDPVDWVFTDPTGQATVDVQFKDSAVSSALRVTIGNTTVLNAVPATVTLTYAGDGPVPTMYGGYMIWDLDGDTATQEPQYMSPFDMITATAYVWDETGTPADGIDSALVVSGTPYGSLVWNDYIMWDSTWDGSGIDIVTTEDEANLVTSGPFNTPFDYANWDYWYNIAEYIYWDWGTMTGVPISGGQLEIAIYAQDVAPVDLMGQVFLIPGGNCIFSDTTLAYELTGPTVISSDYVIGRTYSILATELVIEDPILEARNSSYDETNVDVLVTDENNAPVEGVNARVYQNVIRGNLDYKVDPWQGTSEWTSAWVTTDVSGYAHAVISAIGKNWVVTESSLKADVFATAGSYGSFSLFSQSQVVIHTRPSFVAIDPMSEVLLLGDLVQVNATVTDSTGMPLQNMSVSLVAGEATVLDPMNTTDASGSVVFLVDTSTITNDTAGYMMVIATADGVGFDISQARADVPMRNGSVDIEYPSADAGPDQNVMAGVAVVFNGSGSSDNVEVANWVWTFTVDSVDYTLYGEVVSFTFLSEPHTVVVTLTVYDAQGSSDTDTMIVNVSGMIPEFATVLLPVVGILGILLFWRERRRLRTGG